MWRRRGAAIIISLAMSACGSEADPAGPAPSGDLILPPAVTTPVSFDETDNEQPNSDYASAGLRILSPDFAVVDMVVRTQEAFQVERGGAVLDFAASTDEVVVFEERFTLEADRRFSHPTVQVMAAPGYAVRTFRLSETDRQRMLTVRNQLAEMRRDTPGRNELQLGAGIYGCLAPGFDTPDALNLLVALRITPDGDFHPIIDETTMKTAGSPLSDLFWTPCDETLSN